MTKEEILKKEYSVFASDSSWEGFKKSQTYFHASEAMEQYAQQHVIAFAEWAAEAGWEKHIGENTWFNRMGYATEYTTEQLYNLFIEHQKQQNH